MMTQKITVGLCKNQNTTASYEALELVAYTLHTELYLRKLRWRYAARISSVRYLFGKTNTNTVDPDSDEVRCKYPKWVRDIFWT